jgi:hypothetical protein
MNLSRFSLEIDLWILTALRKTPTTRFPQVLGRRSRAAHRLHRPDDDLSFNRRLDKPGGHQAG